MAAVLILVVLGGGFGPKEDLPLVISILERPALFAHRGVNSENNKRALRDALGKGFPAVELDVQFSSDSIFFLHHDKKIKLPDNTFTTAEEVSISDNPIITQIDEESLNVLTRIPSLIECVEPYKYKLIFYFDMKRYGHDSFFDLARDIAAFINTHNLNETALVASAHLPFITYLEYTHPEIITVMEGIDTEHPWLFNLFPKKFKPDMIASRQATINDDFVEWLKDNDMLSRYIVYHGDESTFQNDLDRGIEMFIIDYAPYLDKYLKPDSSQIQLRKKTN